MASWLKSIGKVNTDQNKETNGRSASTSSYEDNPDGENQVNDNPGEFQEKKRKTISIDVTKALVILGFGNWSELEPGKSSSAYESNLTYIYIYIYC